MFKLLNRFAWVIAIMTGLQFSFFVDRDGPFDDTGFWSFILVLFLVKFFILGTKFIESRLEFFVSSLDKKNHIGNNKISTEPSLLNNIDQVQNYAASYFPKGEQIQERVLVNEEKIEEEIQEEIKPSVYEEYPIITEKVEIKEEFTAVESVIEPSKLSLAIKSFFAENLLAKLGGILVFLGVLFLLSLVYSSLGSVGRIIIGFIIGFTIFISGVILDKKDFPNEGRILLGIGILINYLVILSGRYLLVDDFNILLLGEGLTFLFLIFNTVLAVVTSLVYKSRTLLLFSFIFAFINPLLVGGSSDNPYTLVGYSLIVAFGGLFLGLKQKDYLLTIGVFIFSNILFLYAPISSDLHWIVKLLGSTIISIASIFIVYKIDYKKLSILFIGSYIFLILLLSTGDGYLKETTSFISYMITILLYFGIGIYYFLKTAFNSLITLLLFPIFIILGLSFNGVLLSIPLTLSIIVLLYLVGFTFIKDKLPNFLKYVFFIILGIYIFLTNSLLSFNNIILDLYNFITVLIVSFIFIITSYYLSTKKDLSFLYSIGTIGGIFTLAPILVNKIKVDKITYDVFVSVNDIQFYLGVIGIIIFSLLNWILPFINKRLIENNEGSTMKNLLVGMITGLLFFGYELYAYGANYFPGVATGITFALLAIIYFILAYFMLNKIGFEVVKKEETSKNVIYTYLGVSISLFSLAMALIFSKYPEIISAIWLFEATLMFYFFHKTKESKIGIVGIFLLLIGITKLFGLLDIVNKEDFIFLIPFTFIFISLVLNIKFLDNIKEGTKRVTHDILHILGIGVLGGLLLEIIPSTGHGWSTLGIVIFLSIVSIIYSYYSSKILKLFFIIIFSLFLLLQIGELDSVFWRIDKEDEGYLRILQYITTIIVGCIILIWNKLNKSKYGNIIMNSVFALYIFIITSYYIYDIFNSTFVITMYWGISASSVLFYGISKDIIKLRTIGLYLISLTTLKIFLYDIWFGLDDAISRVFAFILLGVLFIIISTKYTKKYGNNLKGEFQLENITGKKDI